MLNKLIVKVYSKFAAAIIASVLVGVFSYIFLMGFYAMNDHWVIPFIVSPTNDKILSMTEKLVESQATLNALTVDRDRLETSLGDMRTTMTELRTLDKQFKTALVTVATNNAKEEPELSALNAKKVRDNTQTAEVMRQAEALGNKIDADLKAGLITKGDAIQAQTALRTALNAATDGNVAEMLLRQSVRSMNPTDVTNIDTLSKEADLKNNLVLVTMAVLSGEEQLATDKSQIALLTGAIKLAQSAPDFLATKGNVHFAFVGYDGAEYVGLKKPIYSCYLGMILCHRVGDVTAIFTEEETAQNPLFKTTMRGFLIQLNLTEPEAAKQKVLFIGHKPLLF
jgi:chaperonin cofactor prefoldin